jgi:hypothetical protein
VAGVAAAGGEVGAAGVVGGLAVVVWWLWQQNLQQQRNAVWRVLCLAMCSQP